MTVDGGDDGGPDLQLELVHQKVEVDVAHRHRQRGRGQAERVRVSPSVIGVLVLHESYDQVEEERTGESGTVCDELENPDAQEFGDERFREGFEKERFMSELGKGSAF